MHAKEDFGKLVQLRYLRLEYLYVYLKRLAYLQSLWHEWLHPLWLDELFKPFNLIFFFLEAKF